MGRVNLLGHAARPSVARSVADILVGSRSQGEGTRIPAHFSGFWKNQETCLSEPHLTAAWDG